MAMAGWRISSRDLGIYVVKIAIRVVYQFPKAPGFYKHPGSKMARTPRLNKIWGAPKSFLAHPPG